MPLGTHSQRTGGQRSENRGRALVWVGWEPHSLSTQMFWPERRRQGWPGSPRSWGTARRPAACRQGGGGTRPDPWPPHPPPPDQPGSALGPGRVDPIWAPKKEPDKNRQGTGCDFLSGSNRKAPCCQQPRSHLPRAWPAGRGIPREGTAGLGGRVLLRVCPEDRRAPCAGGPSCAG